MQCGSQYHKTEEKILNSNFAVPREHKKVNRECGLPNEDSRLLLSRILLVVRVGFIRTAPRERDRESRHIETSPFVKTSCARKQDRWNNYAPRDIIKHPSSLSYGAEFIFWHSQQERELRHAGRITCSGVVNAAGWWVALWVGGFTLLRLQSCLLALLFYERRQAVPQPALLISSERIALRWEIAREWKYWCWF